MSTMLDSITSMPQANPLPNGDCNGCIDCCKGTRIPSGIPLKRPDGTPDFDVLIPKQPGVLCWWADTTHPDPTKWGCGIYENRPDVCRVYRCWAQRLITAEQSHKIVQICAVLRKDTEKPRQVPEVFDHWAR